MKQQNSSITIIARSSHTAVTPRKANLVLDSIKGMKPQRAIDELAFVTKMATKPIIKLLKQAIGNAADQYKLSADQLVIDEAFATKARVLKRIRFAGRGRIKPYEKVSSHLTVILKAKNQAPVVTGTAKTKTKTDNKTSDKAKTKTKTKNTDIKKKDNKKLVNKK